MERGPTFQAEVDMARKTILTLVAVLAACGTAAAQDRRLVTMTGSATVQSTPDRAWVTVGVEARAQQTTTARERVAASMLAIEDKLKALGIPENALRTASFNVSQDWEYLQGRRNLRGYVVSNQMEVRVDDITKVAAVVDESIAAGANVIHGVRWDVKDRQSLERTALQRAFEDARGRAEVIVAAARSTLGNVYNVHETRVGDMRPMPMMRVEAAAGVAGQSPITNINPGEIDIRATVTVSFQIQG
jgi:uncharacterized protein YggE